MVLDCFSALGDAEISERDRLLASLLIFYEDVDSLENVFILGNIENATKEMYRFFNCGQDSADDTSKHYKLIDWERDSQLISSAVNKVAGVEVRSVEYLHWWTFMGYYTAIGESPISTIIRLREKILKGEKLEKWERKFRQENPKYFVWNSKTIADREADELVKQLWNKGE